MDQITLKKEDYEKILNALEAGIPPNLKYLPKIYTGRDAILKGLLDQINQLVNGNTKIEYAFISGERGQGKTMTSLTAVQYAMQESVENILIPVYIDLGKITNPLEVFRQIYLTILTGAFNLIEFNDDILTHLFRLMEIFSIELNYHKVRPDKSVPPLNLLDELCNIVADLDGIICIIVDELDILSNPTFFAIVDGIMEIFRILNDIPRVTKFWIFCSTQSGQIIFQKAAQEGIAFASRIQQAFQRTKQYTLRPLSAEEVTKLVNTVITFFMATQDQTLSHLNIGIINTIQHAATKYQLPREIIGNTTSMLYIYKELEPLYKKGLATISGFNNPLRSGLRLDAIFKRKLLPLFPEIFPTLTFSSNPPSSPSLLDITKNKVPDGVITFGDEYKVFIELKYTDTKATLTREYLDQLVSALKTNDKSEGVFLLFGVFLEDPITTEDKEWLKACGISERIKYFQAMENRELDVIKNLLIAVETSNDHKELIATTKWILIGLGMMNYIESLVLTHKGKESLLTFLQGDISTKSTGQTPILVDRVVKPSTSVLTPNLISAVGQRTIRLAPKVITGLGTGYIEKLKEKFNITTVNELINLNPDTIASIRGITAAKAKSWIDEGKKLLQTPSLLE